MKQNVFILLLLLIFSFPAVKTLFIPGGYTSHDLTHHVIRQVSMDKLLSEGQFPPRWSSELNNGFGYPVFLFNYPLPALLGEVFHKFGLNFVDSVKAVLFTSMILSVVGMYFFLKELLGKKIAAFLGALFYLYAPLRFINVYVSAAVGSALALAFVPFVFLSVILIAKGKKGAVLGGALSFAFLILSHNVSTLIFAPVLGGFALVYGRLINADKKYWLDLFWMVFLGLGLSCWFWLPSIFESQYIKFSEIYKDFYKDQFISFWQMLRSPWGFGLSHPTKPELGDMSYQLGLIQILAMVLLVPVIWVRRAIREIRVIGGFILFFSILAVFMMTNLSQFIWETIPSFNIIQFPLRFSAIFVFCASIAVGLLIKHLPLPKILFVVLLSLVIFANRNHWKINEVFSKGDDYYKSLKTTSTTYGEHLPKWGRVMEKEASQRLEFVNGTGKIEVTTDYSGKVLAEVEASNSGQLRLNQIYFPGWEIKIDGKPAEFNYLVEGENYGLPVFSVEKGKHEILAEFKSTPDRKLAEFVSILGMVVWLVLLCRLVIPSKKT